MGGGGYKVAGQSREWGVKENRILTLHSGKKSKTEKSIVATLACYLEIQR